MFMSLGRWFQQQCRPNRRLASSARTRRAGLQLEWLEDRVVPATFTVTNTADILNQTGTLRNAIQQANTSADANNTINIVTAGTYAITLAPTNTQVVNNVITAGGTGYTTAPTVTFTGGGGTGAAGTALIANGAVVGIRMTNAGTGYTTAPTVTFTGGGGTGAAATAEVGENDNAAGEFAINLQSGGSLTINNMSGGPVIIDGQGLSRVFDLNPNNTALATKGLVTFNGGPAGITITNGRAATTDDAAGSGGDIREFGDVSLTLNNVTVSNGTGGGDGGGISAENFPFSTPWTLTLNNSSVLNNHAMDAGGGIDEDGTGHIIINNSLISGNSTVNQSGGIWLDAINNAAGVPETASLTITQSVISNNTAGMLGAGFGNAGNGVVTVTNSTIRGNVTHGFGGGFADQNNLGTLVVMNSFFQNNTAVGNGGAIFAGGPSTTITNSEFRGNFSDVSGGGLFLGQNPGGTPATATSTFTISNTTLANNVANVNGGGIEFQSTTGSTSTASLTNSTIVGNSALGGIGGGIDVAAGFTGALTLTNATITNNFATTQGGGVAFAGTTGGKVSVQNSIIANNIATTGPDVFNPAGTFTDLGNNVVGTLSGSTGFGAGTIVAPFTGGALLGGLSDNGGPIAGVTAFYGAGLVGISPTGNQTTVQTEALLPGSAARGKGATVTGLTTDQRGFTRPGTAPDVGAFQFQNVTLNLGLTATTTNGTTTITATVTNNSGINLPADNSVLTLTLPTGLTANGATTFTLPAIAAGQNATFTVTATGTPTGTPTVMANLLSPDANPNSVSTTVQITTPISPPPSGQPTPVGQLLVFALGFVNGQLVLFYVDSKGQIFDEAFNFTNFFTPNPANATFINTDMVLRNMQATNVFGSPGILGNILGSDNTPYLMTTLPLNFISPAAITDLINALRAPGAL